MDIDDKDPIFHTVFDVDDRFQVPAKRILARGCKELFERRRGRSLARNLRRQGPRPWLPSRIIPIWATPWEWADEPYYPEKFSGLAIRIGVNYIVYAMTH